MKKTINRLLCMLTLACMYPAGLNAEEKPAKGDSEDIVVAHFGDSTCVTTYLPKEQRIETVLNARLKAHYKDQKITNINLAKNGETIRKLFDRGRYKRDVKGAHPNIDIALIRYMVNDSKVTKPLEFKKHVEELCDQLLKDYPGIHIILETNVYTGGKHLAKWNNSKFQRFGVPLKEIASERKYPLVDNYARRKKEVEAGNWDHCIRGQRLSKQKFGKLIVDDSKDKEMEGVKGWFGDNHPNPNAVNLTADEEFKVMSSCWPNRLPKAGETSPLAANKSSSM